MTGGALLLILCCCPLSAALAPRYRRPTCATPRHGCRVLAVAGLAIVAVLYPVVADGGVVRRTLEWLPSFRLDFTLRMDGFAWMFAVLISGIGLLVVLYARYYLSPDGSGAAVLLRSCSRSWARCSASSLVGQPDPARRVLGADQPLLVPADRLLAPHAPRATARAWRSSSPAPAGSACSPACCCSGTSSAATISTRCSRAGDAHPRARALPAGARAGAARRADQERAVPVPLLAAARDGGADAGLGLPAFGDDGEGRRVPAGAPLAGAGGHRRLVLDRRRRRPDRRCCSARTSPSSSTTSRACSPTRPSATSG